MYVVFLFIGSLSLSLGYVTFKFLNTYFILIQDHRIHVSCLLFDHGLGLAIAEINEIMDTTTNTKLGNRSKTLDKDLQNKTNKNYMF